MILSLIFSAEMFSCNTRKNYAVIELVDKTTPLSSLSQLKLPSPRQRETKGIQCIFQVSSPPEKQPPLLYMGHFRQRNSPSNTKMFHTPLVGSTLAVCDHFHAKHLNTRKDLNSHRIVSISICFSFKAFTSDLKEILYSNDYFNMYLGESPIF